MAGVDTGHPYAQLTPDRVLDALSGAGIHGDGRLQALGSYENRVYQVWQDDGPPVVVKFYRPQRWSDAAILEEHAFVAELAGRELPVVAPLPLQGATLHDDGLFRFAVYPRCGGRAPELDDPKTLQWLGRFLGRIHAVGAIVPFAHRPRIDPETFGATPRDWLLAHDCLPPDLLESWRSIAELALSAVRACYARAGDVPQIRLHGDCHAGNVLWTDAGPHFVDFDDARTGPAVQDLWMLLSGDRDDMTRQLADVLSGYEDFADFDRRELHLVEALRTLRLLHYSAWIGKRWDDPAFPAAFPWFGTQRYWQDRILELREQVALMSEPPLAP
jgi:Ser/Thr protein kinase RdoA (MazF antagonist)